MSKEKILSVFIDESGDFGQFDVKHPMYYVAMVMHDQSNDISANINALETLISNWGYPNHAIHTGPLIRKESVYYHDLRENRKALFNALYHFARQLDITYICPRIDQKECLEKTAVAYTNKLLKEIICELRCHFEYLNSFDKIIVYYDHGQRELSKIITSAFNAIFSNVEFRLAYPRDYRLSQVADLICTVEMLADKNEFTVSETEFFHSKRAFKTNILKTIRKKHL